MQDRFCAFSDHHAFIIILFCSCTFNTPEHLKSYIIYEHDKKAQKVSLLCNKMYCKKIGTIRNPGDWAEM